MVLRGDAGVDRALHDQARRRILAGERPDTIKGTFREAATTAYGSLLAHGTGNYPLMTPPLSTRARRLLTKDRKTD
jgi:hypothetical protein